MCGIAGVFSLRDPINERDIAEVDQMTHLLTHRGPDTTGFYKDANCVLGNTRLKIIDLSDNAFLPMTNEDESIWIVYNGEATNFRELIQEFKLTEKHTFRSTSDTEVLIHLYEEIGIDFVNQLSGKFAFCLYDKNINRAFVVRDFYGIRPLFTLITQDRFYFASEIKSFMYLDRFNSSIDTEAMFHYFSLAYIPDIHTPFEQIREIQGGILHEIDLNTKTHEEKEYYELRYETDYSLTEENVTDRLHSMMLDSVRRNLISDRPLGMTFSGGFDTSTILALCKELGVNKEMHTFSIVIDEPSFNEKYYQDIMVDFAKPIHHELVVRPGDVLGALHKHMAFLDEPCGDGSTIPIFLLAEDAKKYVSVLLSGEGGDEVFNAYETHGAWKVRNLYRKYIPAAMRKMIYWMAHQLPCNYQKLSFDWLAKRFTEGAELEAPRAHLYWRQVLDEQEKKLLMPDYSGYKRTDDFFADVFHGNDFNEELNRISLVDMKYFFIGDVMLKNDRMIMSQSIEARFPYMDRLLMEFVSSIPPNLRIHGLTRRYIQRQAMKGYLPKKIYRRQNMGLEMPHAMWFLDAFGLTAKEYFTKERIERSGILSHKFVQHLWNEHVEMKRDNGRTLWCIMLFLIWFDMFVYKKDFQNYLT